ncbi:MAG: LD-carboxypeptidase [candidate division KSB1 bacterium]|nr:LD-carboxypeptidase [candidate division KSB1 bacterium]MDZ7304676.1 LD-carboxypeptidase [candidate division KSB1 bacterium]MDZ7313792.1 LD-carboxypeptidase [candidate division KSB1 bacterium]
MSIDRRNFLKTMGLAVLAPTFGVARKSHSSPKSVLKPLRLKPGDTVGLISPASPTFLHTDIKVAQESLTALELKSKLGRHVFDRYGYLAGKDQDRAADVNAMFGDPSINAILALGGGWGCNRILPLLDYDLIRRNPKIIMGYSDVTSLLLAIYAKTGLITFHGPVGTSTWNKFSVEYVKKILFNAEAVVMQNPTEVGDNLAQTRDRVETLTPGRARGVIAGGNLSLVSAMVGSAYLPEWKNKILFLEETNENIYRVDRMLTQLKLAGVLDQIAGFVFGKCTKCDPGEGFGSLTLEEVFNDHIKPLGKPAWHGAMIGHIENKFTVPIGVEVEIDADKGVITMLEPAVS